MKANSSECVLRITRETDSNAVQLYILRQADDGCAKGKSQNSASVSRTEKGIAMNQEWMTYSS